MLVGEAVWVVVPSVRSKCGGVCFEGMGEVVGGRRRKAVVGQSRRWAWWWSRQRRRAGSDDDDDGATFWWRAWTRKVKQPMVRRAVVVGWGKEGGCEVVVCVVCDCVVYEDYDGGGQASPVMLLPWRARPPCCSSSLLTQARTRARVSVCVRSTTRSSGRA